MSVVAFEKQDDTALNWTLNAWLICADPVPGLVRVATTDHVSSYSYKLATADCPAGTKVLSAAGDLTAPGGQGGDLSGGGGVMDSLSLNGGTYSDEGVTVVARKAGGGPSFDESWFPHAYAICASP